MYFSARPATSAIRLGVGVLLLASLLTGVSPGLLCAAAAAQVPASEADGVSAEAVRSRLARADRLSPEEIAPAIEAITRTIRGRSIKVTDGRETMTLDDGGQAVVLALLSGALPIEDLGLRQTGTGAVRGFRSPATPPRSEIGAKQTLWVDVKTLEPRRFELVYEIPGDDDAAFDIRVE